MAKKTKIDPIFLTDFVNMIQDHRVNRTKKHSLENIIVISIGAVMAGANSWVAIADYGKAKKHIFSQFLDLTNGIPSHDTFRKFFMVLNNNCSEINRSTKYRRNSGVDGCYESPYVRIHVIFRKFNF